MNLFLNLIRNKALEMEWTFKDWLTVSFTLFAVIDVVGSIPLLISLKAKLGGISETRATLISGLLMIVFLLIGENLLNIMGVDVKSFAVAGSIVIFILGLELVLGLEFFKPDANVESGTLVPIAFPLIAGSGTLTTIISLKANYTALVIFSAILVDLLIVYSVLRSLNIIARILGPGGLLAVRKFFGVILVAIAVKIFAANIGALFPG